MSQPVTFEMEGTCNDGQMIVVKGWPDFGCQDVPQSTQKVVRQTTFPSTISYTTSGETMTGVKTFLSIQKVYPKEPIQNRQGCGHLWWVIALIGIVSIVVIVIAHTFRKRDY